MKAPYTKIGLTLYGLRDFCKTAEELDTTLARVRKIGYEAVQVSGVGGVSPEDIRKLLDKHQLYCCATHEGFEGLTTKLPDIIRKTKILECDFTALGSAPAEFVSENGVTDLAAKLTEIGRTLNKEGIKFGYHNHSYEFQKITDKTFFQELYERSDKKALLAEPDVFWIQHGGGDPAEWIARLKNRIHVAHFKDFVYKENKQIFCEVGEGNLNWKRIIDSCKRSGVRWYVVEQDEPFPNRDIFTSIEMSFKNLKKMGVR